MGTVAALVEVVTLKSRAMTREEVQKRAHEAHHKWRYSTVDFRDAVDVMTDFAMSLITEAEYKAWEAARSRMNNDEGFKYDSPEDWRKEKR